MPKLGVLSSVSEGKGNEMGNVVHHVRYEAFVIEAVDESSGMMQGVTSEGKRREFCLVVHRDKVTNNLTLDVARHFVDPSSKPRWENSEPWEPNEIKGDEQSSVA